MTLTINENDSFEVEFKEAFEYFFKGKDDYESLVEGAQFDVDMSRCDSIGCITHIQRMKGLIKCYKDEQKAKKVIKFKSKK